VPVNVAIVPSKQGGAFGDYALAIEAETVVLQSVAATVTNSTLRLETVQGFNTSLPIKLVVSLHVDFWIPSPPPPPFTFHHPSIPSTHPLQVRCRAAPGSSAW